MRDGRARRRLLLTDRDVDAAQAELDAAETRGGVADGVAEIECGGARRSLIVEAIQIVDECVQTRRRAAERDADIAPLDGRRAEQIRILEREPATRDRELSHTIDAAESGRAG